MAEATKPTHVDIMMFLDGELEGSEAKAVERYLAESDDASSVAASIGQVSELVRGSVDLDADAAEDRLAGLWAGIEKSIDSNGVSKDASAVAPVLSIQSKAEEKATQELVKTSGWFGGWQSHLVIGAVAAAAAFLLMYTQRSDSEDTGPTVAETTDPGAASQGATLEPRIVPVALRSQEPEVEELEVYEGSGVILTVPADAESDEAATAVIWISSDTDVVEDPI